MGKCCDNCINSGIPSHEYPCTVCETAYGSAPSKWESAAPTSTDMVEVVRCKDCKHWHEGTGRCDQHSHYEQDELNEFDRDYFCAYGERKDNG